MFDFISEIGSVLKWWDVMVDEPSICCNFCLEEIVRLPYRTQDIVEEFGKQAIDCNHVECLKTIVGSNKRMKPVDFYDLIRYAAPVADASCIDVLVKKFSQSPHAPILAVTIIDLAIMTDNVCVIKSLHSHIQVLHKEHKRYWDESIQKAIEERSENCLKYMLRYSKTEFDVIDVIKKINQEHPGDPCITVLIDRL